MNLQVLGQLDPAEQSALDDLVARAEAADQHPALSEELRDGSGRIELRRHRARAVLAEEGGDLVGCATLTPGGDGFVALHAVVDPAHRDGGKGGAGGDARTIVIRAALEQTTQPVRLWIMEAGASDDRAAGVLGFRPERDVVQMRVALPLSAEVVTASRPVVTRPFVVGQDDQVWLDVNNRAFAGHPEQGHWTLETLRERQHAAWFDPAGFLVADAPGGGLIGSCWTKVHRQVTPVLGEIYVISVDPRHHGQGWGRALTVAGLEWLSAQGWRVGMLYTDATNTSAVALYHSLGFAVDHTDRSYVAASVPPVS